MATKKGAKKDNKKDDKGKTNFEDLILRNLKGFGSSDYATFHYSGLNLSGKGIDLLSPIFLNFKSIESINLSNNGVVDPSVIAGMPSLNQLDLSNNAIKELKFLAVEEGWKSLRRLNLASNRVTELSAIPVPSLTHLTLSDNKIEKVEAFGGHPKLRVLCLGKNKITALQGIANLPELTELYLNENKVKSLAGLEGLPLLRVLHLRNNSLAAFDETFPLFESLAYLNLRENQLEKHSELLKLRELPQLRTLIFSCAVLTSQPRDLQLRVLPVRHHQQQPAPGTHQQDPRHQEHQAQGVPPRRGQARAGGAGPPQGRGGGAAQAGGRGPEGGAC
jgi:Leucine-rich repeat (LRR) protein